MPNPASVLYAVYMKAMGLPDVWDGLPEKEQKAWWAVVQASVNLNKQAVEKE